jgi:acyl transferase domain-containing protein/NAD(P)-dependent dehydrogenase (short-subunit alcohol dehydrogenase family)
MSEPRTSAIAVVGLGAVLPDAPDVPTFWENVKSGRYSVGETPSERWDPALYFDPDPRAPDRTYSKIGGWVRQLPWDPLTWRLPIPPKVAAAMDRTQMMAIAATRQALADYGYPGRPLDGARTAVILGNAMAGEKHYATAFRLAYPEIDRRMGAGTAFSGLPAEVRAAIRSELRDGVLGALPEVTEDTMPGELANIIAGRVASVYDFHGPNFVVDAACASAMAALSAAIEGLEEGDFDAVVTGGVDANMGAHTFIKFCKIGALSGTGTRPYADGADGFVMGEGAAVFLLKRLADAERDGDKIYAVVRGVAGSSDGRGKGITAPNPVGQRLAVARAWERAGVSPETAGLIEGHGTSTRVGDIAEVESLSEVFAPLGLPPGSIPLGSVKSNLGHLKGAAGAAGLLKASLALSDKLLPPSLNCERPNPHIDFAATPFYVNGELRPWAIRNGSGVRRAGVSAFGFGGTNFHAVLEEHVPGRLTGELRRLVTVGAAIGANGGGAAASASRAPATATAPPALSAAVIASAAGARPPLRGALLLGADSESALATRLEPVRARAAAGEAPPPAPPAAADLAAPLRLTIDFADAADLAAKGAKAAAAFAGDHPGLWRALRAQGIFLGRGPAAKVAFLYTGQGSQYAGMLAALRAREPIVAATFAEADAVMEPLLGRPLSAVIFPPPDNPAEVALAEEELRQTAITQPAVLTVDVALTRLLAAHGVVPDLVMGHSLGEYAALVAAGALPFAEALEAVSARGREMTRLAVADPGKMAAVFGPVEEIDEVLAGIDGYVVVANLNSRSQAVIGGASEAVDRAVEAFVKRGRTVRPLNVSHAFHTALVAPACEPLRAVLGRLSLAPPRIPVVANASGEFYPEGADAVPAMIDLLAAQIAAPVRFVQGLEALHAAGARVFVEVGPKRALAGFVEDVVGGHDGVLALVTNQPKLGDVASFNQALCGLWASGRGGAAVETLAAASAPGEPIAIRSRASERLPEPTVVVTGAALGLPGTERVFDDGNLERILHGEPLIDAIPLRFRHRMVDKHVTRLVKTGGGGPRFEVIEGPAEAIKLAARKGALDLVEEFGFPADRAASLDVVSALAIGAGIDALRDAGIPLVMRYKTTTRGTRLPERWGLPDELRDSTGVIFASAFPGLDAFAGYQERYRHDQVRRARLAELSSLRARLGEGDGGPLVAEIDRRIHEIEGEIARQPEVLDHRFLFRVLSMGHSQFAELIGARGPNTQVNAACASTAHAVTLAGDWIRAGRCRRVVVISGDDVTSDSLIEWFGAGFLASGAAATDELAEDAAIPFDRRRHGLVMGMGAAALVVESAEAAAERGLRPICELLGSVTANSAFHGSRLDIDHIGQVMETLVSEVETRWGLDRRTMAEETLFVSHETYTPARGGSAQAEVDALRRVFGPAADRIVIANTKGFTGHPMAVGIEDVVALKALETGLVPPVPNHREDDPDLGRLNLSRGGAYPLRYALRLGAGFGSQIAMTMVRWLPAEGGVRRPPAELGYAYRVVDPERWRGWLARAAGDPEPELEVVQRTLRLRDRGLVGRTGAGEGRGDTAAPAVAASRPAMSIAAIPAPPSPLAPPATRPVAVVPIAPAVEVPPTVAAAAHAAPIAPTSTAPAPVPPPAADGNEPVRRRVLEIVAAQTGYPADMLDPDLDLEADLGIDTVKQAEMFAAIRGEWGIPRDENLQLRDYPTLAHAVQFVYDRRPDLAAGSKTLVSAAVVPAAPAAAVPPPLDADEPVRRRVLEIVAAQTGYPADMLDPDLDLEADLGIDTVKQAEMFAAIRGEWGIPRDENLQLRDYPTLAHAVRFVYDRRPDLAPQIAGETTAAEPAAPAPEPPPEISSASASALPSTTASPEPPVEILRRVPVAVLRPPLEFCAATGVALGAGSRVVLMPDRGGVGRALAARLEKLGVEVLTIDGAPQAAALEAQLHAWLAAGPVQGVYWLPALDAEGDLATLEGDAWGEAVRVRVKLLAVALRVLYDAVGEPGSFLVAATRLGGRHGYDEQGAVAPLGGAVCGFVKAYGRERPEALVKAVDFARGRGTAALADRLLAETLRDPGAVEVGTAGGRRWSVGLVEEAASTDRGGALRLGPDSLFVVTGAAGSIVSAIVADLAAAAGGGTFHLLDLAEAPAADDPDLARSTADRDGLKRDLAARLQAAGERPTPALVERELARIERRAAAQAALDAVHAAGGRAVYRQLDLTDADAVDAAIAAIAALAAESGRVDVLVHAAGVEISRRLPDKPQEQFDRVFDVKADGWHHLLRSLDRHDLPLGAAVVFGSIAGRFGNAGQTDYSAANDFLAKGITALRRDRPGCRGIALDWTAWSGIGMASRGSIPQVMAAAGIDMLPPELGVPVVRRELTAGGSGGEVVVAGRLGAMLAERAAAGGLDLATGTPSAAGIPSAAGAPLAARVAAAGPMVGRVAGFDLSEGLAAETDLDPRRQPFLDHHRIEGTAVLPGVMGIEGFAEVAALLFPELRVAAVEGVEFLAPFKFYRDEPRTVTLRALFRPAGDEVVAHCRLLGRRDLAGQAEPRWTTHFTARVRLVPAALAAATAEQLAGTAAAPPAPTDGAAAVVGADDVYRLFFHGPAYRVIGRAWRDDDGVTAAFAADLPSDQLPSAPPTRMEPRLIELGFQAAGVEELARAGRMALPLRVDRVAALRRPAPGEPLFARVHRAEDGGSADVQVVDGAGHLVVDVVGYRTVELPGALDGDALRALEALAPAEEPVLAGELR